MPTPFPNHANVPLNDDALYPAPAGAEGMRAREERIWELVEGQDFSSWFHNSAWRQRFESGPGQIAGPVAIRIDVSDPFDLLSDTHRMVLVWDDEVIAAPLQIVEEGRSYVVEVPEVRGDRLAVWLEGIPSNLVATVTIRPLSDADNIRADMAEERQASESGAIGGAISRGFGEVQTTTRVLGLGALAIAGVVAFLYVKSLQTVAS